MTERILPVEQLIKGRGLERFAIKFGDLSFVILLCAISLPLCLVFLVAIPDWTSLIQDTHEQVVQLENIRIINEIPASVETIRKLIHGSNFDNKSTAIEVAPSQGRPAIGRIKTLSDRLTDFFRVNSGQVGNLRGIRFALY